ncbi:unnamed protein product [Ectocarpus sp. 12 AP-2014]
MDGFRGAKGSSHVIVVGATNRPGALDPALRRPGRFDRELALAPPDVKERTDILRHHLRRVKVAGGESTIQTVSRKCVGYVGADLAALAREAALLAARTQASRQCRQVGEESRPLAAASREALVEPEHLSLAMERVSGFARCSCLSLCCGGHGHADKPTSILLPLLGYRAQPKAVFSTREMGGLFRPPICRILDGIEWRSERFFLGEDSPNNNNKQQ